MTDARESGRAATVRPDTTIAIVGLGLMGGSLALALRRASLARVIGVDADPDTRARALRGGAVDSLADLDDAATRADMIVFATPVRVAGQLVRAHAAALSAVPVVTDLCSVKSPVLAAARAAGLADRFVGGHPMTGRERSGFSAASADLYDGARVWLVPASEESPVARVAELWLALGARPEAIDAESHDRMVALTSHTPQVASSALALALARAGVDLAALGPGGRDTTRIAASPESLWADILVANSERLEQPLDAVIEALQALREAVLEGDVARISELMAEARAWREQDVP